MANKLPDGWHLASLEDRMAAIIDYRGKTPRKTKMGIPLITAKIVKGGRIETPTEFIDPEDYEEWMRRGLPRKGDVLITTEAPLGEVAQLGDEKVALAQRLIALRGDPDRLSNTFLKFLLQSEFVQSQLLARSSGTTVYGIKQSELRKVQLLLPPIKEQQAIACILGALDDKIELNRRMIRTLEAMAQAIFKSWFVDFDPVRAKASGQKPPGLKPEIAALFPDSLEDSEVGEIPRGWRVETIGKLCEFAYGKALKADDRVPGPFPVMGSNGQVGTHNSPLAKGPGVVVGRKGNPGIVTWVNSDFFPIDTTFFVIPLDLGCPLTYLGFTLERLDLANLGADSAVPGLNRNIAYGSKVVRPITEALGRFDEFVLSVRRRQDAVELEARTLAAIRDTLLPKLISGELRVPDAERIAGRCT